VILIAGAPLRIPPRLHIAAFVLLPDRTFQLYTKHHLGAFSESARCDGTVPPAEATVFRGGDRDPLIRFGEDLAAIAVCGDINQPSHPERAAGRGATTYLASMFVIPSHFEGEIAKLSRFAVRHSMMMAMANFGSPSGGLASAGRSTILSEAGDVLIQLPVSGAGVGVVTESRSGLRTKAVMLERHGRGICE
jgi:predicted amidohydrolase